MNKKPVALVTGAARNIGLAVAHRLATDYTVILVDRDSAVKQAHEVGLGALFQQTDISDADQCQALIHFAESQGALTTVVHCAAISAPAVRVDAIDHREWQKIIEINLNGTFYLMQAAYPALQRSASSGLWLDAVSAVLFTSRAAKTGFAALNSGGGATKAHYCASKAGVISLTKSLALEWAEQGIRVNGIAPGPIEGEMIPSEKWPEICAKVPLKKMGKPQDLANAVYFLVRPTASFITGHILDVNGGTLMD